MPAWNPLFLGSTALKFFIPAYATTGISDGGTVTTATGLVNSKHAVAAAGEEPTFEENEINGRPILRFPGTDEDMTITAHGLTKPCTVAVVCKITGGAAAARIFASTNMLHQRGGTGNNDFVMNGGSGFQYSTDTLDANYHIHVLSFAGTGDSTGSFDGVAATGSAGTGAPSANMILGSGGAANFIGMDLACILGINGLVAAENILRIEGWLAHTFGLAANLPGGHAYKSAAPIVTQSGAAGVF